MTTTVRERSTDNHSGSKYGAPGNGDRGPARFSLASAVGRHWLLALLPVVVLIVAGIAAGAAKKPTYSSSATINVGKSDIATQATPGYLTAAEALASAYSRLVTSQNIVVPAARAVGESPSTAASQLTAVPIPDEPTFTITATGSSAARATALAHASVSALVAYVGKTASQQGGPAQLLSKYRAAQTRAVSLQQRVSKLMGAQAKANALGTKGPKRSTIVSAKVAAQTAQLQAQALSNQYVNLSSSGVSPELDVLNSPTPGATTTNRTTNVEKYAVIGAVAGIVIGIAFAGLAGAFEPRRRRPSPA